jgi:DNA-binding transcriptional MerR regulator
MIPEHTKKRIVEAFSNLQSLSDHIRFYAVLAKPKLSLKDTGVSSRVLSHWKEKNILPSEIVINKGWNKFDFADYIWIKIVQELRIFGLPLKTIKKVKDYLYQTIDLDKIIDTNEAIKEFNKKFAMDLKTEKKNNVPFDPMFQPAFYAFIKNERIDPNILEFSIVNSIIGKKDVGFDIYSDGEISIQIEEYDNDETDCDIFESSHIYISITQFIEEFLTDGTKQDFIAPYMLLTQEEVEVLRRVRQKDLQEIVIQFPKGSHKQSMDIITKKNIGLSKKQEEEIVRILNLKNYQSISIKTQKGGKLYVEKSHRKKLDKNI